LDAAAWCCLTCPLLCWLLYSCALASALALALAFPACYFHFCDISVCACMHLHSHVCVIGCARFSFSKRKE
jgi:hypothetical protein